MAKLIYSMIASLDGYIADASGNFDWAAPDEEVHSFANDLQRSVGTCVYGRRMYEVMAVWETSGTPDEPPVVQEFARAWRDADKIVYSTTLERVTSDRTRIERAFDPQAVRQMKDRAGRDISIGGAGLAASAIRAGIVDEFQLFIAPAVVGGGTAWLPDDVRIDLELLDERAFSSGMVYARYGVRRT